jgi:glycerophosphoryl diester phosphodiesterase
MSIFRKVSLLAFLAVIAFSAAARPKIIAHRGYWRVSGSAQNSMASFTKADSIGVFGSEMDVWLTKDNKLIVNHDKDFMGHDIENSTKKESTSIILPNGENLPTLEAYLKLVKSKPNTRLILEMKSTKTDKRNSLSVKKIAKQLKKYKVLDQTDIISFSMHVCLEFKSQLPNNKVFYLNGDKTPAEIKDLKLDGIDYDIKVLREHPDWIKEAHNLGLEVNVWTVDTFEDLEYITGLGVDYITTNEPDKFLKRIRIMN